MTTISTTSIRSDLLDVPPAATARASRQGYFASLAIIGLAVGLMAVGAVITFSASLSVVPARTDLPWWQQSVNRHLLLLPAGLVAMLIMARAPSQLWSIGRGWFSLLLLVMALVLTSLVYVPGLGLEVNNARRWIAIPGLRQSFQPSELIKLTLPIFIATWTVHRLNVRKFFRGLLPLTAVIGVCVIAVGLEDFGTAALIAAVGGGMLVMAGARWSHLMLMVFPAVPAFGYLLVSRAHRMERLKIFLDPWSDASGAGYQVIQSLYTIASGSWYGVGLGNGFAKGYLPEARNDFVFAVICEELGMVGAVAVIGLFIALIWQAWGVVGRCLDPVGRLLALGIALTIGLQATINIAVVTASAPTKGIALPLVSAGGSGAIFLGAMIGILAGLARNGMAVGSEK